jgi:hypothetical protein
VRNSLTVHIALLDDELRMTDSDLDEMVMQNPAWRERG